MGKQTRHTIFSLLLALFAYPSFAQEIKFLTEQYPPFIYLDKGQLKGISTEVVNEAMHLAGIRADLEIYPFARTMLLAEDNQALVAFPIVKGPERDKVFNWIGQVARSKIHLFKLANRPHIAIAKLEDALFYSVSSVRGGIFHALLKEKGFKYIEPVTDIEQGVKMLRLGHVDLLATTEPTLAFFMKSHNIPAFDIVPAFHIEELDQVAYLAASKSVPESVLSKLTKALDEIHASGRYQEIEKKYLNN